MGNITLNKPSGGQLTIAPEDGTSNETVTIPSVGVGKVLNVWNVYSTSEQDLSSVTSYIGLTGLSVTLTPSSSSSKFLLMANIGVLTNNSGRAEARITRDGVGLTEVGYMQYINASAYYNIGQNSFTYLDSPATASSITYALQGRNSNTTGQVNFQYDDSGGQTVSYFTVMEVAA